MEYYLSFYYLAVQQDLQTLYLDLSSLEWVAELTNACLTPDATLASEISAEWDATLFTLLDNEAS